MQLSEEGIGEEIDSSVAYFHAPLWSSTTIINLDDYCRLFESRSVRLIKEAYARMLESSSSPYDTFINNSIQLVHMAKVRNRLFCYLFQGN
jgi:hypothetical protein